MSGAGRIILEYKTKDGPVVETIGSSSNTAPGSINANETGHPASKRTLDDLLATIPRQPLNEEKEEKKEDDGDLPPLESPADEH